MLGRTDGLELRHSVRFGIFGVYGVDFFVFIWNVDYLVEPGIPFRRCGYRKFWGGAVFYVPGCIWKYILPQETKVNDYVNRLFGDGLLK